MTDRPEPGNGVGSEIRDADWYGDDLSGVEHSLVAFTDIDLTESTGHGAIFTGCTFGNCRFNAAAYSESAFVNCTFNGCTFFDASFTGCKFVGSVFAKCSFDLLKVEGGDWSFVALVRADLRRARFLHTRMREADLTGASCQEAYFVGVDLSGASLQGADLSGCDLRGSDLTSLDPAETLMRGAIVDAAQTVVIALNLGLEVRPSEA